MGIDISGGLSLSWTAWAYCLDVAQAFGWQPEGTLPPPDPEDHNGPPANDETWDGSYYTNDFQTISDSDAHALAAALDRAIVALTSEQMTDEQHRVLFGDPRMPPNIASMMAEAFPSDGEVTAQPRPMRDRGVVLGALADRARHGRFRIF